MLLVVRGPGSEMLPVRAFDLQRGALLRIVGSLRKQYKEDFAWMDGEDQASDSA